MNKKAKEKIETQILFSIETIKNDLQLLIDSGNYKRRREHKISDVEYDKKVKEICLQIANMQIDNGIGAAIINSRPMLRLKWKTLRSSVIRGLNYQYGPDPENEKQEPGKPKNPSGVK